MSPAISAPFCAPRSRSRRVSLRVSMSAIATTPRALQPFRQRDLAAPVARAARHVAHDQAGGEDLAGLRRPGGAAGVADVRIGQRHQLPRVGRIGEDLLVAGHGGVEHHFADRQAGCAYG